MHSPDIFLSSAVICLVYRWVEHNNFPI